MVGPGYYPVGISNDMLEVIKRIIVETKLYRNPSEFVTVAVREKITEIQKMQIDQRKLEAFFMRENQIKAEHLGKKT
jgi:metal-responsive CopG/Arc/MetJ family transcriptional regulator